MFARLQMHVHIFHNKRKNLLVCHEHSNGILLTMSQETFLNVLDFQRGTGKHLITGAF